MNGWFIALVILYVLGLGINLAKHGEKNDNKFNFWSALFMTCVVLGLAYMSAVTGF